MEAQPLVAVVDDDESVRDSLRWMLRGFGFTAHVFSSAEAFLASESVRQTRCLILDVTMPRMSGPELYQALKSQGRSGPTIFITAQEDPALRTRLLVQGATECIFKPITDTELHQALLRALRLN